MRVGGRGQADGGARPVPTVSQGHNTPGAPPGVGRPGHPGSAALRLQRERTAACPRLNRTALPRPAISHSHSQCSDGQRPSDPLNAPLLDAINSLDPAAVARVLAADPGKARLPGPRGSTSLSAVFAAVVTAQAKTVGAYWVCNWDWSGHVEVLRLLLEAGAEATHFDNGGLTAGYVALAGSGCLDCLELLVEKKALSLTAQNIHRLYPGAGPHAVFRVLGQLESRQMPLVSKLLKLKTAGKASLAEQTGCPAGQLPASLTALLGSETIGRADVAEVETPWRRRWFGLLLRAGLPPDLRDEWGSDGWRGETLMLAAARRGWAESVELLLAAGADPALAAADGSTPLQAAAAGGYSAVVDLLLAAGVSAEGAVPPPGASDELRQKLGAGKKEPPPAAGVDCAALEPAADAPEGWAVEREDELAGESCRCDVEVREALTLREFLRDFYGKRCATQPATWPVCVWPKLYPAAMQPERLCLARAGQCW